MKINEIYTAFVTWQNGGKRRPILIIETENNEFYFLKVTSKYSNKSERIKKIYYPLQDWQNEGLKKQSYIDVGTVLNLSKKDVSLKYVGKLTIKDRKGLAKFIENIES
ncbi:MAG: MazF family toxin-antitoxin system [Limosilactobacillus sp.]|jgi:uncharacterized protein (UPF0333 family)|uniref:MazF family toxin-antitoxin system n=1 Tax=Limosilactobacillus sp. TaxID=2773925 RepID=UPI0025C2E063|nr:MazF family toxin-antitoxin system [Limosilactobacillus sp.]MCI1974397.1 MazF family toxin-antitoxin system [Limosilactobacillus sp.]MCI2030584.1 MazF family toxin-antitoxin system [Limosilactobacillus sp.]